MKHGSLQLKKENPTRYALQDGGFLSGRDTIKALSALALGAGLGDGSALAADESENRSNPVSCGRSPDFHLWRFPGFQFWAVSRPSHLLACKQCATGKTSSPETDSISPRS